MTERADRELPAHAELHAAVLSWYAAAARDLPWRRPGVGAWAILVSEFMLQQTPVARVLPFYDAWIRRWPDPAALAADPPGEAVRAWGRLGYPRRAVRLHACARACVDRHDGAVPRSFDDLLALPGVGRYTAGAVASFAYGQRHPVLDTNVRRVQARAVAGQWLPAPVATASEWRLAETLLPAHPQRAATWAAAVMELGALVCVARAPRCPQCPIRDSCAWRLAGCPPQDGPARRAQDYVGTDRQCRGRLLAVVRDAADAVPRTLLEASWPDSTQRSRALDSLAEDGLIERLAGDRFGLPTERG